MIHPIGLLWFVAWACAALAVGIHQLLGALGIL